MTVYAGVGWSVEAGVGAPVATDVEARDLRAEIEHLETRQSRVRNRVLRLESTIDGRGGYCASYHVVCR